MTILPDKLPTPPDILDRPPWHRESDWRGQVDMISRKLDARPGTRDRLAVIARSIMVQLERLAVQLDRLNRALCAACTENCCQLARVHFTETDILVMRLVDAPIPPGQPVESFDECCRYLGRNGCRLDRASRPWQCTRFLCRPMESRAQKRLGTALPCIATLIRDIECMRSDLLNGYRRMISPVLRSPRDRPSDRDPAR